VLYDDRLKVSPGVSSRTPSCSGMPTIVVVGRNLADGVVEVRDRRSGIAGRLPVDTAVDEVRREVAGQGWSSNHHHLGQRGSDGPQTSPSRSRRSPWR
jgi:hypothetical protein